MKLTIDTKELEKLITESNEIFLSPDGDKVLQKFLQIKELVEKAEKDIKERLEANAKRLSPNFKSIQGDNVVVYRREYGAKYYIEEDKLNKVPSGLYETKIGAKVQLEGKTVSEIVEMAKRAGFEVVKSKRKGKEVYKIDRAVDSKAVEKWVKENGGMPYGVFEDQDRKSSITFRLKDHDKA